MTWLTLVRCNCGHIIEDPVGGEVEHDPFTGKCRRCGCQRGDVLPAAGERLTFGQHRIRDIDARTAPAWDPSGPTLAQRRAAIDRVLRHEEQGRGRHRGSPEGPATCREHHVPHPGCRHRGQARGRRNQGLTLGPRPR